MPYTQEIWYVVFLGSVLLNLIVLIRYFSRSQVLRTLLISKYRIPSSSLSEIDPVFAPNEFGTTLATEVDFVGRAGIPAAGAIRDSEGWVLAVLAKNAKRIF